ncbi:CpaF family protein [Nitrolancea hollandica]|uniref:Type II secretion system protein E n=1 Tax=Nitrolancea hollandica Lb TaxID=1129897 RepID=I4EL62_9BACT|nr:ATPase, T2SS/T4P/T4SS family [Nitrolancea hollandica]CCF85424.1 Type II secretion system protein E [Nitrolancea hollandica Lb]
MTTTQSPLAQSKGIPAGDRAGERLLRAEMQEAVSRLLGEAELLSPGPEDEARIRVLIRERVSAYQRRAAATNAPLLSDPEGVERRLFDRLLRLGVLQPLIEAPGIEEIICNGPNRVFVIEDGRKRLVPDLYFEDDEELRQLVKRLVGPLGRRLDASSPMVDVRLPDGSRLNAAIPPATTRWTSVTIRKFILRAQSLEQLIELGTLTDPAARFLDAAVQGGVNILVSGPTGSGKTTLLNALGSAIASTSERVITVEEVAELQLERHLPDCVALQARAGNIEGAGEIRIRDLVRNALRMRPTRIVVGEVRGAESLDMLLAMNTGHEGSLTTIHGNTPRDALDRLVTLAMMAEERLSGEVLAKMAARTIELVIQVRFEPRTGRRRVATIFEVTGLEGSIIAGNAFWTIDPTADRLKWTGIQPRCLAKIAARGVDYMLPTAEGW